MRYLGPQDFSHRQLSSIFGQERQHRRLGTVRRYAPLSEWEPTSLQQQPYPSRDFSGSDRPFGWCPSHVRRWHHRKALIERSLQRLSHCHPSRCPIVRRHTNRRCNSSQQPATPSIGCFGLEVSYGELHKLWTKPIWVCFQNVWMLKIWPPWPRVDTTQKGTCHVTVPNVGIHITQHFMQSTQLSHLQWGSLQLRSSGWLPGSTQAPFRQKVSHPFQAQHVLHEPYGFHNRCKPGLRGSLSTLFIQKTVKIWFRSRRSQLPGSQKGHVTCDRIHPFQQRQRRPWANDILHHLHLLTNRCQSC